MYNKFWFASSCYRNTEQPCIREEEKEGTAKEQNQLLCV